MELSGIQAAPDSRPRPGRRTSPCRGAARDPGGRGGWTTAPASAPFSLASGARGRRGATGARLLCAREGRWWKRKPWGQARPRGREGGRGEGGPGPLWRRGPPDRGRGPAFLVPSPKDSPSPGTGLPATACLPGPACTTSPRRGRGEVRPGQGWGALGSFH